MQGLHPDLLKAGLDFATKNPAAAASFAKDAMQPQGQKTGAPETAPGTEAGPEAGPGPTAAAEGEPGTQPPQTFVVYSGKDATVALNAVENSHKTGGSKKRKTRSNKKSKKTNKKRKSKGKKASRRRRK